MSVPHEMNTFIQVVERGSFAAAANELTLTPSAVSKIITRLEDRLGVQLLIRTTRSLTLTSEGETYLMRCREILEAIEDAESEVSQAAIQLKGLIRISTFTAFGRYKMPQLLTEFLKRYPEVEIELNVTDRRVEKLEEKVDIAFRSGDQPDSSLIARKVVDMRRIICASPDYLERYGVPRKPDDLRHHNCILMQTAPHLHKWPFKDSNRVYYVKTNGDFKTDNADVMRDFAITGHGIIRMVDLQLEDALRDGLVVPILTKHHVDEPIKIWSLTPPGRQRVPRVRTLINFIIDNLERPKSA